MSLKSRLARLQKLIGTEACFGPIIDFVEVWEGEEPPDPPPCPCGSKHLDRVHQIVVVLKKSSAALTEADDNEG